MVRVQLMIGATGRSYEVTWGHNPFFASDLRQDGDRDAQMLPDDLARQSASEDMHIDLFGSWRGLDLLWPEVKFWNWSFSVKKVNVSNWLDKASTMVSFLFWYLISKSYQLKTISGKNDNFFIWWPLETKLLNLRQMCLKDVTGAWEEFSSAF